jgi:hypothetical protein
VNEELRLTDGGDEVVPPPGQHMSVQTESSESSRILSVEIVEEPTVQSLFREGALKGRDIHPRVLSPWRARGNARSL